MNNSVKLPISWPQVLLSLGSLVIVFGGLGFFAWIVFQGFATLATFITRDDLPFIAALTTAVITVSGALTVAWISHRSTLRAKAAEKEREVEQELRKQKAPTYEEFVRFVFKILSASQKGKAVSQQEMLTFVYKFNEKMIVWGGDSVLMGWNAFKAASQNSEGYTALFSMEDILFAIRSDMGHDNSNMKRGDLLLLFVNDMHTVLDGKERESAHEIVRSLKGR